MKAASSRRTWPAAAGFFHGINIKLVKCGGMTPARRMIDAARRLGLKVMMGCMTESTRGHFGDCPVPAAVGLRRHGRGRVDRPRRGQRRAAGERARRLSAMKTAMGCGCYDAPFRPTTLHVSSGSWRPCASRWRRTASAAWPWHWWTTALVHAAGFGTAKADTIFRAGWIQKVFNAVAIMQLVEAGQTRPGRPNQQLRASVLAGRAVRRRPGRHPAAASLPPVGA